MSSHESESRIINHNGNLENKTQLMWVKHPLPSTPFVLCHNIDSSFYPLFFYSILICILSLRISYFVEQITHITSWYNKILIINYK